MVQGIKQQLGSLRTGRPRKSFFAMVKIAMFITGLNLIMGSCSNSMMPLVKKANNTNSLRFDGYYYVKESGANSGLTSLYFLYENGVILYIGSVRKESFEEIEDYIRVVMESENYKKNKTGWGVFRINNSQIEYDMWYPRFDPPVYRSKGEIFNDSTFAILSFSKPNGKELEDKNDTYHFRQFNPKPDSTNNFIK